MSRLTTPPEFLQVQDNAHLLRTRADDRDPRGIIWLYEPPRPNANYVMGIDPTVGITGWHRALRSQDDSGTDNGAIEIIRVGDESRGEPDTQVAEYAAPIDSYDLADVANTLGRIYGGRDEDGMALCVIEVYPGPGMITLRRMIDQHGYTRQFVWKYRDNMTVKPTASLGWYASPKAVRDLWIMGTRHVVSKRTRVYSPWLVEEMTDCERDEVKQTSKAIYGSHDDRVRAFLMALWAAHDWTGQVETISTGELKTDTPKPEWQSSDTTFDEMMGDWSERMELDWEDEDDEPLLY